MHKQKKWLIKTPEPILQWILSKKLGISTLMAQILINRGIYTVEAAREFLDVSMQKLHSPLMMRDMSRAVEITASAIKQDKKILVYGDYDVDGITGTTLLVHVLRRLGAKVEYYIPHRIDEGYGLHTQVLQRANESGVGLILTVDCGISNAPEVEASNSNNGPQIIITDHHEPPSELPPACAVVNPKQKECDYSFKDLAGVGVAFKLVQALLDVMGNPFHWEEYLDLVCLGTIADVVPLNGENRIFVKYGLPLLAQSSRPGLQALCQVAGLKEGPLDSWEVGFILAPRLNAAGRLGNAKLAVDLLLSEDYAAAWEIASLLNKENQERQKLEAVVLSEALGMLDGDPELAAKEVLVLASENWHPGVIGIVASRLVERFYKPVLLIACEGEQGKGSARSIKGFHLYHALEHCSDCLDGYGGHAMAAGFSLPVTEINRFRDKINTFVNEHILNIETTPTLELDAVVSLEDVTYELIKEINLLAPYGHGNPGPMFGLERAKLINYRGVGKKNAHLKMLLAQRNVSMDGIGFNLGQFAEEIAAGEEISIAFTPSVNNWQGRQTIQAEVKDIHKDIYMEPTAATGKDDAPLEDNCLREAGGLIFVPETIIGLLKNFLMNKGHPLPPSLKNFQAPLDEPDNYEHLPSYPAPFKVSRESLLDRLHPSDGCTLFLTNSACHTLQLFRHINKYNDHFKGKIAYLHGFMPVDIVKRELSKAAQEETKLIISTIPVYLRESKLLNNILNQVLLEWVPITEAEWYLINHLDQVKMQVSHLKQSCDDNCIHLRELAPDREVLARYYSLLKSTATNGLGNCRVDKLLNFLERAGYHMNSCISLIVSLAVFADLDLLQYNWQEDMLKYKLLPAKGKKMDLAESPTYVWTGEIKSAGLKWIDSIARVNGA